MTRRGGWDVTGFGDILKKLRATSGMTQAELADSAGCHKRTISQLERGEHEPAWPLVLALKDALDVDISVFLPPAPARKGGKK